MLDAAHALTRYDSAPNGHVALTAAVRLDRDHSADLALGFATTDRQALRVAGDAADQSFTKAWSRYERQWERYDSRLRRPSPRLGFAAARQYYRSVNVVEGERGQDLPRRDRSRPGVPVGTGGRGQHDRQRQAALLRLLSRGVRPRPVRGVQPACSSPATCAPLAPPRASCSRTSSRPMARCRATRWRTARWRRTRRRPARRDVVSDPDGLAIGPCGRSRPVPQARDPGGRLPRRPRPDRRSRALGGAERLLAVDDRRRDRGLDGCRAHRVGQRRLVRAMCAAAVKPAISAAIVDGE